MPESAWDPAEYERFRDERQAPFFDLLALVRPRPRMRVLDLGCGTGELTSVLHRRLEAAETLGIDRSDTMLARSAAFAAPGLRFVRRDIEDVAGAERFDLVFSNAALQWVPGHEALLAALTRDLAPGGQLAVQMPANWDHPSHTVAAEVAGDAPFRDALGGWCHPARPVLAPEEYAALLHRLGYAAQHVRLQVYGHLLGSADEVVEWMRGSLLTAYRERLPAARYEEFLGCYRERLRARLGEARPYFFTYKRILLWAERPA
jgi:trans-aconitate 2-methyltransferase